LQFNEYLKLCREHSKFTQEELVHNLYSYNIDDFRGLDTTTLSKWERGVTKPKISKQVNIIKYFQKRTNKELVLNFPDKMIAADDLKVSQLRNSKMIDKVIDINIDLDKGFNHKFTELLPEHFKEWALHPSNSFYVCEYNNQFFGLLFTLRLKPDSFEQIMDLTMREKDLTLNDFASFNEMGCNYIISFFAMNNKAASILFIRYYAHLIANQKVIQEVGVATMMEDARKLLSNMHFIHHASLEIDKEQVIQTYRETLPAFLACEKVVKMILSKQECPEE